MALTSVSFLGSSTAQIGRLKDLSATLDDLERQISTSKKTDTLAGLGTDALSVQRLRMSKSTLDTYSANIDTATSRINLMSSTMTTISSQARELISTIQSQVRGGSVDMSTISNEAKQLLSFVGDAANVQLDGRYLFSGSDTTTPPVDGQTAINANMQQQVSNWLNGTITTDQLGQNVNALSTTQLGINAGQASAGAVTVRVDDGTDIDYTVKASDSGMQDIIRALGLAANLTSPASGDTPDLTQLNAVLSQITDMAQKGADALDSTNASLGAKYNLLGSIGDQHKTDSNTFETMYSNKENADTTEAVAKIQSLQTQLQASYQVTSVVSQLSLVNFLS